MDKHDCLKDGKLEFVAHYAAPGIGQAWICLVCSRGWVKIGDDFHDPASAEHIMGPEDVI